MLTTKKITEEIGHPNLKLYRGKGYQYFVYDNGKKGDEAVWVDHCVYVYRLNMCSLDWWATEGKDFIEEVEKEFTHETGA